MWRFIAVFLFATTWAAVNEKDTSARQKTPLPVVDLGYGLYQATLNVGMIFGISASLH
jgi:hypothetical protein